MNWTKNTTQSYGDYTIAWVSDYVSLAPDLPQVSAVIGVLDKSYDDPDYSHHWLLTHLMIDCDESEYPDCDLYGFVEIEAALQYDKDPDWLGRAARRVMGEWLNYKPDWFVEMYRERLGEADKEPEHV